MITRRICGILVMVVLLATAAMAATEEAKNWVIDAGVYYPTSGDTRDGLGSTWLAIDVGYKVAETATSQQIVDIGWINAKGKTHAIGPDELEGLEAATLKTKAKAYPLRYTYLAKPSGEAGSKMYYGAGGGVYFIKAKLSGSITPEGEDAVPYSFSDSLTKFGVHVCVGANLAENLTAELRYTHVFGDAKFKVQNVELGEANIRGLSLMIGGRF